MNELVELIVTQAEEERTANGLDVTYVPFLAGKLLHGARSQLNRAYLLEKLASVTGLEGEQAYRHFLNGADAYEESWEDESVQDSLDRAFHRKWLEYEQEMDQEGDEE